MLTLPVPIAFAFIKDKEKWALLENLCEKTKTTAGEQHHLTPRQAEREALDAPCVPAQVAQLFQNISVRGLKVDSVLNISVPQKLVSKLTERGCVPLLISMANSPHDNVSLAALAALGDISRNKDCRLLMLQDPNGVNMIRDLLGKCSNGSKVSPALLLIVHLLWDEEWRHIIAEFDDPPVETVLMRWAVFAMKEICRKASQVRKSSEKYPPMLLELGIKKLSAPKDSIEAEQAELKLQELQAKQENVPHWCSLERQAYNYLEMNCLLRRSLMCMCHLNMIGAERIERAGILHLAACVIDVPDFDTYGGAIIMIQNYCATSGKEIKPADFPDPDHFLRSVIIRIERFTEDQEMNQTASVFMSIAARMSIDPAWQPYFDRFAAQGYQHRFTIEHLIRRMVAPPFRAARDDPDRDGPAVRHGPGTSGPTAKLGGRLAICDCCGKIEGKVGELKNCSKCRSTKYCNRECQLKHWKQGHKKECAKLAAALAANGKK